jgi:elongation factor G
MANDNNRQPWLIEVPIEPKSKDDLGRIAATLARLAAEDPSFGFAIGLESGQIVLKGMGELHLDIKIGILRSDIKVDIFRRAHKVSFNVGAPRVAYREKITKPATVDYVYQKHNGVSGQFARVTIGCEPLPADSGFKFENRVLGGAAPRECLPGVERGLESVLSSGVVAGRPVVDLKVTLIDAACHEFDSSAFELASRAALREALLMGAPVLLEPIMNVEVVAPEDFTRLVVGDLNARRGQIRGEDQCGNANIISAMVPLNNMFGYAKILRSMSQGRATSVMQFDHYAPVSQPKGDSPFKSVAAGMRGWVPLTPSAAGAGRRETVV